MSDRVEYWWVNHEGAIEPAEVAFRAGIPTHARLIGSTDDIPSTAIELMERLPAAPRPVFAQSAVPSAGPPRQPFSRLWLVGIVVLTLIYLFSGQLFDAIK